MPACGKHLFSIAMQTNCFKYMVICITFVAKQLKYAIAMKKIALFSLFLFLFLSSKAQDRIISMNRDTIHCKIVSISNNRILYETKDKNGYVTGKFISLAEVAEYSGNQLLQENLTEHELKTPKNIFHVENPWCLSINAGLSTMPWYFDDIQFEAPDYFKKLKNGIHINTNAYYMLTNFWGMGVEYSFFNSNSSGSMQSPSPGSIFSFTVLDEYRQYINYLGASTLFQQHIGLKRKLMLRESLSAGALFYRLENQSTSPVVDQSGYQDFTVNSLLTGSAFSANLGLALEYQLFPATTVGFGSNFLWSSLKKASFESKGPYNYSNKTENQELTNPINLSRIDFSLVVRYNF